MPPALTDYEFCLDENGYILNTDFNGTFPFIDVTQVTGLDSAPIRVTTVEHESSDGTYIDAAYLSMRTITISGTLYCNAFDTDTLLDQLKAAYTSPVIRPFYYQLPAKRLRFVWAQGGGIQYDVDVNRRLGQTPLTLTLLCSDPYIYDYPGNFATITAGVVPDIGVSFNLGFPAGFGGTMSIPFNQVTNFGTHTAYPVITLKGPLTNPSITDTVLGITMRLNLVLHTKDTLVIDNRYKTIIVNGGTSRRQAYLGLKWFTVPPGTTGTFLLAQDAGTGSMSIVLYNTYW